MILFSIAAKLKQRVNADSWYLGYPLSCRDIEELFLELGLEVDRNTLNR